MRNHYNPLTYAKAVELLGGRSGRKVRNNTYVEDLGNGVIGVRLHSTYVVKIRKSGKYELNSGGWHTDVTAARINEFVPREIAQVYIRKGDFKVGRVENGGFVNHDKPFKDGMVV